MNHQSGFIALTSSIIIASLLMIAVTTLGFASFFSRSNILYSEFKKRSDALAESCVAIAIIRLQNNSDYVPDLLAGDSVSIGSEFCNIWSIEPAGSWPKTIEIKSFYPSSTSKKSFTNLVVTVSKPVDEVVVDSWIEVPEI